MRSILTLLLLPLATSALATFAFASDGVLEINQTCAVTTGCFPGDTPGLPVTIAAAGSYRLTGNLVIPDENTTGIRIEASDVELDLAGFAIVGQGCVGATMSCVPAAGTGDGIVVDDFETRRGNSVRNGSITGMGRGGVALGPQSRIEAMHLRWNVNVGGYVGDGSTLTGNTALGNTVVGLFGTNRIRVSGNIATENGGGIVVAEDSLVIDNESVANTQVGIDVGARSQVVRNVANSNGLVGIGAQAGSLVTANQASLNQSIGIFASGPGRIANNLVRENTQRGLTVFASGAHVEGNTAEGNGEGFFISGTGHLVLRNTARANTSGSYVIDPGNSHGPIVTVTGAGDLSTVTGADHPWANFEY